MVNDQGGGGVEKMGTLALHTKAAYLNISCVCFPPLPVILTWRISQPQSRAKTIPIHLPSFAPIQCHSQGQIRRRKYRREEGPVARRA